MSKEQEIGDVAELIGKTLQWAVSQVAGIPAIKDIDWRDLGEIDFVLLGRRDRRYRLTVSEIGDEG